MINLHEACYTGNIIQVELLLGSNVDVNQHYYYGVTPLMIGPHFSNTNYNLGTVKLLLDNNADPNLVDFHNWSALMYA